MEYYYNKALMQMVGSLALSVKENGYVKIRNDWHARDVRSPFSRLYFVLSGSGVLTREGEHTMMQPDRVYLIPAGTIFDYGCDDRLEKLYFHINILRPDGYDLLSGCAGILSLPLPEGGASSLLRLYRQETMAAVLEMQQQILFTVCRFLEEYRLANTRLSEYSPVIKDTICYIQSNLSIQLNIPLLAERVYVSGSTLTQRFRQEVGTTISRYIDDLVFFSAERELLSTDRSIRQISDGLGFCDAFYFSRRFRQRYGETPDTYRRRMMQLNRHLGL